LCSLSAATTRHRGGYRSETYGVFTSNVFAILGLRSLYFALAGVVTKFRYLKAALAIVLMVVGVKMLVAEWLKLAFGRHFNLYLLWVVLAILGAGVDGGELRLRFCDVFLMEAGKIKRLTSYLTDFK
jgi:predicted tellurium resistance membrane protein TerC